MQNSVDTQILSNILQNLVTKPESVVVERIIDEQGVLLKVQVDAVDMAIVIGRNGSMAQSLKTIMKAVGKANQMNIRIMFDEQKGAPSRPPRGEYPAPVVVYSDMSSQSDHTPIPVPTPTPHNSILDNDLQDLIIN